MQSMYIYGSMNASEMLLEGQTIGLQLPRLMY